LVYRLAISVLGLVAAFVLAACGSSSTTVVNSTTAASAPTQTQTVTQKTVTQTTTAKAPAPSSGSSSSSSGSPSGSPPDVVGEKLPQAKADLLAAGYHVKTRNTDTTFGIIVPTHYTICTESDPQGDTVTVLAQKYGC
jgi:uncharacterized lipoprotein YajG